MAFPTNPVNGQTYQTSSGTLYVYDSSASPAGAWTISSAQLLGVTGANGVTGLQGTVGNTGLQGASGLIGATGIVGGQGIPGGVTGMLNIVINGGDDYVTTGYKADVVLPFNIYLNEWTVLADAAGSITFGVWKAPYANFPPTASNAINSGATGPLLLLQDKNQNTNISDWGSVTGAAGEVIRVNVGSVTGLHKVTLSLKYNNR